MRFEKLGLRDFEEVSEETLKELLGSKPDMRANNSLQTNETVIELHSCDFIILKGLTTINGTQPRPSFVAEATVKNASGHIAKRTIFLNSLLRRNDTTSPFQGMIGNDKIFKKCDEFTNSEWFDAFKKAAPFHVAEIRTEDRTFGTQTRKVRELILAKGAYTPKPEDKK